MAQHNYRGADIDSEIAAAQVRPDTRRLGRRASNWFQTTDGVLGMMMIFPILALFTLPLPISGEFIVLAMALFYSLYVKVNPKKVYDFPYRVPQTAKLVDGSSSRKGLGNGITFLGREISSKLEIWSGNSDLRTHMLVLGTTGSGKTEFLLGLVYNALVQNSGFIYTDGKGSVDLWENVFRLARYLGREEDLLLISFLTSGRDFLEKQVDRTTNTMNPFALGSSGMLIELIIALMDDSGGGGDMWKGRAIAFISGLTRALCYLRDKGYFLLDANTFVQYFELPIIERMVWDKTIVIDGQDKVINEALFEKVLEPLKSFILTLPGYKRESKGNQEQKTVEQHGFIVMQLTRLFGDMSFTYGYLFQTPLGEVDMFDVVINRRILVVLLPALERAPDSLRMLGKIIVGAIKQMMAGCLGNRVEGMVREIVKARPTNAPVPFYVVLDEYGYYAVLGFAVAPAQARSLGFAQPKKSLVATPTGWRSMGSLDVGDEVCTPRGAVAKITQVHEHGAKESCRIRMADGRSALASQDHLWTVYRSDRDAYATVTTAILAKWVEMGVRCSIDLPAPVEMDVDGFDVQARRQKLCDLLQLEQLADDFVFESRQVGDALAVQALARSLGMSASMSERRGAYTVAVDSTVLRIPVLSVEAEGWDEMRCLTIDSSEQLYVTDEYVVTHNCITFAAQDFSSLQKASKEEADATWENTNVRAVGRITGGKEAETFRRIDGVGGEVPVYETERKEHRSGAIMDGFSMVRDAVLRQVRRISYDDLAQQEDGEFTFVIGKKQKSGVGGVRVIRARSFYTQVPDEEKPREIRINHLLKVEPPRSRDGDEDSDIEVIESLEVALKNMMVSGGLAKVFPDDPIELVKNKFPVGLYQMRLLVDQIQLTEQLPLRESMRAAMTCLERFSEISQANSMRAVEKLKRVESAENAALAISVAELTGEDVEVAKPADGDGDGDAATTTTTTTTGGGDSGGGVSLELVPVPMDMDGGMADPYVAELDQEASDGPAATKDDDQPQDMGAMVRQVLDDYDYGKPDRDDTTGQVGDAAAPVVGVSVLTLRSLGRSEEVDPTDEFASYSIASGNANKASIVASMESIEMVLGKNQDPLSIQGEVAKSVDAAEKAVVYYGAVEQPPTATPESVDDLLAELKRGLEEKAASKTSLDM